MNYLNIKSMKTYIKNFFKYNPNLAFFIVSVFIITIYTLVYYSIGDRNVIFSFISLVILLNYIPYLFIISYIIHMLNNCLYISYYFNLLKFKIINNNINLIVFYVIIIILGIFIFFSIFMFLLINLDLIPIAYAEEPTYSVEELEELLKQEKRTYNLKNSVLLAKTYEIRDLFYRHTFGIEYSVATDKIVPVMAETLEECHDDTRMNYYAKECQDKNTELKKYINDELSKQLIKIDKIDAELHKLKNMDYSYQNKQYVDVAKKLVYYKNRFWYLNKDENEGRIKYLP